MELTMNPKRNISSIFEAAELSGSSFNRWLQVMPLAILVTVSLFIFMERLIHMADMVVDDTPDLIIDDVHWEEPIIETRREQAIERPPTPQNLPAPLPVSIEFVGATSVDIPSGGFEVDINPAINIAMVGNLPIAQYLAAARYPALAIRREIEGYVDVIFDVTEYGSTDNIRVLAAQPEGVFERAAIKAVAQWRYQPKMVDEKPVRFEGMKNRVRFEMEKS